MPHTNENKRNEQVLATEVRYVHKVERFFSERGLAPFGQMRDMVDFCASARTKQSQIDSNLVRALALSARLAQAWHESLAREYADPSLLPKLIGIPLIQMPFCLRLEDLKAFSESPEASHLFSIEQNPSDASCRPLIEGRFWSIPGTGHGNEMGDEATRIAWADYIGLQNFKWTAERFEQSINALLDFADSDLCSNTSVTLRNLQWCASAIGAPESQAKALALIMDLDKPTAHAGFGHWYNAMSLSDFGSLLNMISFCAIDRFPELAKLSELFSPSSAWTQAKILESINSSSYVTGVHYRAQETVGKNILNSLWGENQDCVIEPWRDRDELMESFFSRPDFPETDELKMDAWEHVGREVADAATALAKKPLKILIWGGSGVGKTRLGQAIAAASGRLAFQENASTGSAQARLERLRSTASAAAAMGNSLAWVDNADEILSKGELEFMRCAFLDQPDCAQIWIASDLKDIEESTLRRFDMAIHVPSMPLPHRKALAESLWSDKQVAARVAQAMKTPGEIHAAWQWCKALGDDSWPAIARKISGDQKAEASAKKHLIGAFDIHSTSSEGPTVADFAGNQRLLVEIEKIAQFFETPERFATLGAKAPKGYMLTGPAGSGKTMFTKVLSNRVGVPMVVASGASLADKPELIPQLFAEARKRAPCILFVDEFDVCAGRARSQTGMNLERQKLLNLLLVELDGFDPLEGVIFMAATHNGDEIDPAVLRPGRIGRELRFGHPSPEDREKVWASHLRGAPTEAIDLTALSQASRGFSNAMIAEACERARWNGAIEGASSIDTALVLRACDEIYWGEPDGSYLHDAARRAVAVHEAGHALVAILSGLHPLRATVNPRDGFLGAVQVLDDEGSIGLDKEALAKRLAVSFGGYAAEKLMFGKAGEGARGDFANARRMINSSLFENGLAHGKPSMHILDTYGAPQLSEFALKQAEDEARTLGAKGLELAERLLSEHKDSLDLLATELLAKKELSEAEMRSMLGYGDAMASDNVFAEFGFESPKD